MAEGQREIEIRVGTLLVRKLDVESDREAAALLRAAVRRLHHAGAAARDDRPAELGVATAGLTRLLVLVRVLVDARCAVDSDCREIDAIDCCETFEELMRVRRVELFDDGCILCHIWDAHVY